MQGGLTHKQGTRCPGQCISLGKQKNLGKLGNIKKDTPNRAYSLVMGIGLIFVIDHRFGQINWWSVGIWAGSTFWPYFTSTCITSVRKSPIHTSPTPHGNMGSWGSFFLHTSYFRGHGTPRGEARGGGDPILKNGDRPWLETHQRKCGNMQTVAWIIRAHC